MNNPSLFCTPGPPSTWCGLAASSPKKIASSTSASLNRKFLEDVGSALEEARQRSGAGRDGTLQIARRRNLSENVVRVSPRRPHQSIASGPLRHLILGLLSACIGCSPFTGFPIPFESRIKLRSCHRRLRAGVYMMWRCRLWQDKTAGTNAQETGHYVTEMSLDRRLCKLTFY